MFMDFMAVVLVLLGILVGMCLLALLSVMIPFLDAVLGFLFVAVMVDLLLKHIAGKSK
jgi:hypothetical protein